MTTITRNPLSADYWADLTLDLTGRPLSYDSPSPDEVELDKLWHALTADNAAMIFRDGPAQPKAAPAQGIVTSTVKPALAALSRCADTTSRHQVWPGYGSVGL